jgi:adenosylcobinamide-GDP ribazoletransferase
VLASPPVNDLVYAVRYLTIVPWPDRRGTVGTGHAPVALGAAAAWFPLVGLGIGVVLALVERATARIFPTLLAGLITIVVWKLLTGGLHLDGLADCLDGLAGRDVEHRLAIMRDSRIGSFGAMGLILVLLLDVGALAEVSPPHRWRVLVVAPVIGRAIPVVLARLFPPARPDGQGADFRRGLRPLAGPLALGVATLVALGVLGAVGVVAMGVAALVSVAFASVMVRRLNGITGDVLGAAVELAELAVLLTVTAWVSLRP